VNESPAVVAAVLDRCGLDLAQLSGDEPAGDVTDPASPLFSRAYKALRPRTPDEAEDGAARFAAPPGSAGPRLLLDTPHGRLYGGTGETGDWALAATLAARLPGLMLAGGLTPDNVAAAVAAVRPFAVDVAGGVERAPGVKDADRVRAFIARAKGG
jgi:phosphoribosylanthranilate isomerase